MAVQQRRNVDNNRYHGHGSNGAVAGAAAAGRNVRPPKTWCQYVFDISYDLVTCALAAIDVVSDVIIALQFYQQGLTVYHSFNCSCDV